MIPKTRGFQLSQLMLQHIDFLAGMELSGVLTEEAVLEEIAKHFTSGIPAEARPLLLPFTGEVYRLVHQHFQSGRKKIAVYMNTRGQRYIAADYYVPKT